MRKLLVVAFCLLTFGTVTMAQTKMETKWHCSKPTASHKFDVGDVPDHSYAIVQGTCAATSSTNGEKTGAFTEFQEVWKGSSKNHGQFNVTMDNGDITYYTYEASGPTDVKSPASNKWNISGGTGKHKDMKGSGVCSGTRHDDGSSDWLCTGTS
jgi:hypothetical protein